MVPIHTKPPSKAYDEGWDAIFGNHHKESVVLDPAPNLKLPATPEALPVDVAHTDGAPLNADGSSAVTVPVVSGDGAGNEQQTQR